MGFPKEASIPFGRLFTTPQAKCLVYLAANDWAAPLRRPAISRQQQDSALNFDLLGLLLGVVKYSEDDKFFARHQTFDRRADDIPKAQGGEGQQAVGKRSHGRASFTLDPMDLGQAAVRAGFLIEDFRTELQKAQPHFAIFAVRFRNAFMVRRRLRCQINIFSM